MSHFFAYNAFCQKNRSFLRKKISLFEACRHKTSCGFSACQPLDMGIVFRIGKHASDQEFSHCIRIISEDIVYFFGFLGQSDVLGSSKGFYREIGDHDSG